MSIQSSYDGTSTLYLVPTPIGNLADMTYRSVKILQDSAVIYCEDTRVSLPLLQHYNINKPLKSLYEHNEENRIVEIKQSLDRGESISLISDAGMPNICDPGFKLVKSLVADNYHVVSLPGANAFITALASSGLNTSKVLFLGFLDKKASHAREVLQSLLCDDVTAVFYESPHRINKTLKLVLEVMGDIEIVIAREISKFYETIYRGCVSEFIDLKYKGEIVLLLAVKKQVSTSSLEELISDELLAGNDGKRLITSVASKSKFRKNEIYKKYLEMKGESDG